MDNLADRPQPGTPEYHRLWIDRWADKPGDTDAPFVGVSLRNYLPQDIWRTQQLGFLYGVRFFKSWESYGLKIAVPFSTTGWKVIARGIKP